MGEMRHNADASMKQASEAARRHNDTLPNGDFIIHEASPVAEGLGKPVLKDHVKQFPGDRYLAPADTGSGDGAAVAKSQTEVKAKKITKKTRAKK